MVHNIQGEKKKSHTYFGEKKGALALLVDEEKTIQVKQEQGAGSWYLAEKSVKEHIR